jgi:hypothetical protein
MMSKPTTSTVRWWEPISFFLALMAFLYFRLPLVPLWWMDFQSDFALVGVMAQHTKQGFFPIYFYGQNYMGGAEWLTAALLSQLVDGANHISHLVLRINSLAWWFSVGVVWFLALRREKLLWAHMFLWASAFGSQQILRVSVLQEMSPQPLVFAGVLFSLWQIGLARKMPWLWIGLVSGIAWWVNQGVVFFLVPLFFVFTFFPEKLWQKSPLDFFLAPERKLQRLYTIGFLFGVAGIFIGLLGGLHLSAPIRLKVPNGLSLTRDVFLLVAVVHLVWKFVRAYREKSVRWSDGKGLLLFFAGFLVGFAPSWLGRILGLYEKSYGVGLGILPVTKWGPQFTALVYSLYELIFSAHLFLLLGGVAVFVIFLRGFSWNLFWKNRICQFLLVVVLSNVAYVFLSDRAEGAPIRYLYPAYVAVLLLLSYLAVAQKSSITRLLGIGIMLVGLAYSSWISRNELLSFGTQSAKRKIQLESVTHLLAAGDYKFCWGDYWTAHVFAFLSEGQVVLAPHPSSPATQVRIRKDFAAVRAANPDCYLYREGGEVISTIYFSDKNPWVKR